MIKRNFKMNGAVSRSDVSRLMCYYDRQFVELAYRLFLDRDPDPSGLDYYLSILRNGESRREIIFQIASSDEAKGKGVTTDILQFYPFWRRIQRIPVIGALLLLFIVLLRIRIVVREFRRMQNAAFGNFQELK